MLDKRTPYLIIIIITALLYIPALSHQFIIDDFETILDNPHIKSHGNPFAFFYDKTTTSNTDLQHEIYRPIKNITCWIEYFAFRNNPIVYHLTNIILHVFVCLLLFKIFLSFKVKPFIALLSVIYFAIHPALIHNVSYISGRADILCALFILLTLFNHERLLISLVFFTCACFSKENALSYLLILPFLKLITQKKVNFIPYLIISIIYFSIRSSVIQNLAQTDYMGGNFWICQFNMIRSWALYFCGIFWPLKTEVIPSMGIVTNFNHLPTYLILFLLILLISCFLIRFKKHPRFIFGFLWFICFLAPVANIIPIKALFSWRFFYLPAIGGVFMLTVMIEHIKSFKKIALIFIWLSLLLLNHFNLNMQFHNDLTLWKPITLKYPKLFKSYRVISMHHQRQNEIQKAKEILLTGLKKINDPHYLYLDLAKIDLKLNQIDQALKWIEKIKPEKITSEFDDYETTLIYCWLQKGYFQKIIKYYDSKNDQQTNPKALFFLAHAYTLTQNHHNALKIYQYLLTQKIPDQMKKECHDLVQMIEKNLTKFPHTID